MTDYELKFCPECGTKTLELEEGHTKVHCAECGLFFTLYINPNSKIKKGFLLKPEESIVSKDPNFGKSMYQIARSNPGIRDYKRNKYER